MNRPYNDHTPSLIARYRAMREGHASFYFDAEEWCDIAAYFEDNDDIQQALSIIKQGLKLHPDNVPLLVCKAKYLLFTDDIAGSERLIYNIPNQDEDSLLIRLEIHLIKEEREAYRQLLNTVYERTDLSAEFYLDLLDILVELTPVDELEDYVNRVSQLVTDPSMLLRELALIYEDKEEYLHAAEIYNRLIDEDAYSVPDWINLAKIHLQLKEHDKAIEACDFVLSINPVETHALSLKGYCYYDMHIYDKAIEYFEEFGTLIEEKNIAYEMIAECYGYLQELEKAHTYLLKAYVFDPTSASVCFQLGVSFFHRGEQDEAIRYFRESLAIDPSDTDIHTRLAEIYLVGKRVEEAKEILYRALEISPDYRLAKLILADIFISERSYDTAKEHLQGLFDADVFNLEIAIRLLSIHLALENMPATQEMVVHIEQVIEYYELTPNLDELLQAEVKKAKRILKKLHKIVNLKNTSHE